MTESKLKLKLKDIKSNPNHPGIYDEEQVNKLVASIKTVGIMRSFAVFKIKDNYHLVCGHHLHRAALAALGKDYEVSCELNEYDDDTADWGMMVENLTQKREHKKIAIDLKKLRDRLRKRFKNYNEFIEFMKKKGVSFVGNPDETERKSKRGRTNEGRPPEIGSARNISDWLNRHGKILEFQKISEYLMVIENLSPSLFKKIEEGESNRLIKCDKCGYQNKPIETTCTKCKAELKEHEEVFNWTNALRLASVTKDNKDKKDREEEQEELLKALDNSIAERVHRIRTRSKILTKYKKLKDIAKDKNAPEKVKKESKIMIEAIRQGKKDISLIDLPYVELPSSLKKKKAADYSDELISAGTAFEYRMEDWIRYALEIATPSDIEQIIIYLKGMGTNKLNPFVNRLIKEAAKIKLKNMKGGSASERDI